MTTEPPTFRTPEQILGDMGGRVFLARHQWVARYVREHPEKANDPEYNVVYQGVGDTATDAAQNLLDKLDKPKP